MIRFQYDNILISYMAPIPYFFLIISNFSDPRVCIYHLVGFFLCNMLSSQLIFINQINKNTDVFSIYHEVKLKSSHLYVYFTIDFVCILAYKYKYRLTPDLLTVKIKFIRDCYLFSISFKCTKIKYSFDIFLELSNRNNN